MEPQSSGENGRRSILLICPRWYPVPIGKDFLRRSKLASVRFRLGDREYPSDLAVKKTSGYEVPYLALAIASHLGQFGYRSEIIDLHVEIALRHRIEQYRGDILCAGIECERPYAFAEARAISKSLRSVMPGLPIIWYGYASTVIAKLLCEEGVADIVIRGQPEVAFTETVKSLSGVNSLSSVKGLTYSDSSRHTIANPARHLEFDEKSPPPDYSLLPVDCYSVSRGHVTIRTSVGCASQCAFCWFPSIYARQYAGLSPDRVVEDLCALKSKYDIHSVTFADQSFFQRKDRVEEICRGIIKHELGITWQASGQIHLLNRYSDELIELLSRSGCTVIQTGIESGSRRLLKMLRKPSEPGVLVKTVKRLREAGIRIVANFIFGLPGEEDRDFSDSWELIRELQMIQPGMNIVYYYYIPYPGNVLFERLRKEGKQVDAPRRNDLMSWAVFSRDMESPWFMKRYNRRICLFYHVVSYDDHRMGYYLDHSKYRSLVSIYRRYARWRLKHNFFRLAPDYHLARIRYQIRRNRYWRWALKINLQ